MGITIAQSIKSNGAVPSKPVYGTRTVSIAETTTAISRNLLDVKLSLNALFVSDLQFHTISSSCRVAWVKAMVCASAKGRPHTK